MEDSGEPSNNIFIADAVLYQPNQAVLHEWSIIERRGQYFIACNPFPIPFGNVLTASKEHSDELLSNLHCFNWIR
jgi:hypothetical protein